MTAPESPAPWRLRLPRLLAASLMPLFVAPTVEAAKPLAPPLSQLTGPMAQVMVATAGTKSDAGTVAFEQVEALVNTPDAALSLRLSSTAVDAAEAGRRYIVAYSAIRKHPQYRDVKIIDPEGPRVLTVKGLGQPALFHDHPALRELFRSARSDPQPQWVLRRLLTLMQGQDPAARALALLELRMRVDLLKAATPEDLAALRSLTASTTLEPQLHSWLLRTAAALPAEQRADWLAAACREVLASAPVQLELASHRPQHVLVSLETLAIDGLPADTRLVAPFLYSNAPGVVKAAIGALDALDRDAAPAIIGAAAYVPAATPEIARILQARWMQAALAAPASQSLLHRAGDAAAGARPSSRP